MKFKQCCLDFELLTDMKLMVGPNLGIFFKRLLQE
jgi:hypothetical protein